jgi:hypothetical protein
MNQLTESIGMCKCAFFPHTSNQMLISEAMVSKDFCLNECLMRNKKNKICCWRVR